MFNNVVRHIEQQLQLASGKKKKKVMLVVVAPTGYIAAMLLLPLEAVY